MNNNCECRAFAESEDEQTYVALIKGHRRYQILYRSRESILGEGTMMSVNGVRYKRLNDILKYKPERFVRTDFLCYGCQLLPIAIVNIRVHIIRP